MSKRPHVWITGGGSGLGAELARALGARAFVSVSGRRKDALLSVVDELGVESAFAAVCDVTDDGSVAAAHASIVDRFGPVDVLVSNAGTASFAVCLETSIEEYQRHIDVNLIGSIRCIKRVLPSMLHRAGGMIMSVNSVAATTVFSNCTAYAASKAGLLAYTRGLRAEIRQQNVKVVDVILGATATDIWSEQMLEQHRSRMAEPFEVAQVLCDVVSRYDNPKMMIEELTIRPQLGDL